MTAPALETLLTSTDAVSNRAILDALGHVLVGARIEACVSTRLLRRFKLWQVAACSVETVPMASADGAAALVGLAENALIDSFRLLNVRSTVLDLLCPSLSAREDHLPRSCEGVRARANRRRKPSARAPLQHQWDFGKQQGFDDISPGLANDWPDPWLRLADSLVFETVPMEKFWTQFIPDLPFDSRSLPPAAEPGANAASNSSARGDLVSHADDSLAFLLNGLSLTEGDSFFHAARASPSRAVINNRAAHQKTPSPALLSTSKHDLLPMLSNDLALGDENDDNSDCSSQNELITGNPLHQTKPTRGRLSNNRESLPSQNTNLTMLFNHLAIQDESDDNSDSSSQNELITPTRGHVPHNTKSLPSQDATLATLFGVLTLKDESDNNSDASSQDELITSNPPRQTEPTRSRAPNYTESSRPSSQDAKLAVLFNGLALHTESDDDNSDSSSQNELITPNPLRPTNPTLNRPPQGDKHPTPSPATMLAMRAFDLEQEDDTFMIESRAPEQEAVAVTAAVHVIRSGGSPRRKWEGNAPSQSYYGDDSGLTALLDRLAGEGKDA
ncbi:hypothetical protein HDU86_003438 [Geranomyces michiganensis]|nr:hypothetical protein HDU86_003438 [Geranomyces michiganensis]